MTDVLRPGFASEEPEVPEEPGPPVEATMAHAHYDGLTDTEAAETWKGETLCLRCIAAPVCRHAAGTENVLIVISRCLAYVPGAG